jgi:preprotein translocase subunit YajC
MRFLGRKCLKKRIKLAYCRFFASCTPRLALGKRSGGMRKQIHPAVYNSKLPVYRNSTENYVFFISNAYAQAPAGGAESSLLGLLPIILMFVVLWFLMIRPQMKRQKEHKAMVEALAKGDEVVTAGGIVGKVTAVKDQYVSLEVSQSSAEPVEMLLQKAAVQTVLPKGTIKAL